MELDSLKNIAVKLVMCIEKYWLEMTYLYLYQWCCRFCGWHKLPDKVEEFDMDRRVTMLLLLTAAGYVVWHGVSTACMLLAASGITVMATVDVRDWDSVLWQEASCGRLAVESRQRYGQSSWHMSEWVKVKVKAKLKTNL